MCLLIVGVFLFLTAFYSYNAFFPVAQLSRPIQAVGIAMIHSIFNISVTLVLLPFSRGLEKLAILTVPNGKEDAKQEDRPILDERLLNTPAVATYRAQVTTVDLANLARSALLKSMSLVGKWNEDIFASVRREEDAIMVCYPPCSCTPGLWCGPSSSDRKGESQAPNWENLRF